MSKFIKIIEANLWESFVNVDSFSLIEEVEDGTTLIRVAGIEKPYILNIGCRDFVNEVLTPEEVINPNAPIGAR